MHEKLKRWATGGGAALLAGGLLFGPALAADYEVRMPVEKTARMTLPGEIQDPDAANKTAKSLPPAATDRGPVVKAPKTALGRAAEAAAASPAHEAEEPKAPAKPAPVKKPAKPAPAAPGPEAAPVAASPAPKPAAPVAASPVPAPVKPAPAAPKIDPLAQVLPPAETGERKPLALPAEGKWTGEITVEFQTDSIILRVPTSGPVERVTWFNVASPGGPRKLACDLRGAWKKKGGALQGFTTGPVKAVATGEHPDRLRVAIEFRDGAVRPDLDPKVELGSQGVTLTIPLAVRLRP